VGTTHARRLRIDCGNPSIAHFNALSVGLVKGPRQTYLELAYVEETLARRREWTPMGERAKGLTAAEVTEAEEEQAAEAVRSKHHGES